MYIERARVAEISTYGPYCLTFWRRNYFFLILAHPVYKMWIIREPNKFELWNELHFEEKKRRVYIMFNLLAPEFF